MTESQSLDHLQLVSALDHLNGLKTNQIFVPNDQLKKKTGMYQKRLRSCSNPILTITTTENDAINVVHAHACIQRNVSLPLPGDLLDVIGSGTSNGGLLAKLMRRLSEQRNNLFGKRRRVFEESELYLDAVSSIKPDIGRRVSKCSILNVDIGRRLGDCSNTSFLEGFEVGN